MDRTADRPSTRRGAAERPGAFIGALVGLLSTAPLVAVLYLGWEVGGLPFVPFDLFDWIARILPGAVVTFGIDTIVAALRAFGAADLSAAAKTAEQVLAILGVVAFGTAAGAVLYGALRRTARPPGYLPGLVLGAATGLVVMLVSLEVNATATAGPVVGGVWVVLVFLAWGTAYLFVYRRLILPAPAAAEAGRAEARVAAAPGPPAVDGAAAARIGRRRFLIRLGGASAAITVVGAGLGVLAARRRERLMAAMRGRAWSDAHPLPNADARVLPVPGTRPELTPVEDHYRIDINTRAPRVREDDWRLRIGGLVERPASLTLEELRSRYAPLHQFITLSCISNPIAGDLIGTTRWTGVPLRRVLADVGPLPRASHLRIRSVDGYDEVVALEAARADERIMLAYAWDGLPLPAEHGFPLRIYVPDVYGMKQPKWIESIEAIEGWEPGYWVRRGWDAEARMHAVSVIDVVAPDMNLIEGPERAVVRIGGIAHAGARGISRVAVSVDGGPWSDAELREPLSEKTWVLWRYDWPFEPGEHTFTVRCWDGDGTPQTAERTPVRPDGATGLHSERAML